MIEKGEVALNVTFERKTHIASASSGSLNVAQLLCFSLAARAGILETQAVVTPVAGDLGSAAESVMATLGLKYRDLIRAFASLGGRDDDTCVEILGELGRSEDGVLSLQQVRQLRPELTKGVEQFLVGRHVDLLAERFPDYEQHILYDREGGLIVYRRSPALLFLVANSDGATEEGHR